MESDMGGPDAERLLRYYEVVGKKSAVVPGKRLDMSARIGSADILRIWAVIIVFLTFILAASWHVTN